jgi:hypothetical protein
MRQEAPRFMKVPAGAATNNWLPAESLSPIGHLSGSFRINHEFLRGLFGVCVVQRHAISLNELNFFHAAGQDRSEFDRTGPMGNAVRRDNARARSSSRSESSANSPCTAMQAMWRGIALTFHQAPIRKDSALKRRETASSRCRHTHLHAQFRIPPASCGAMRCDGGKIGYLRGRL